MRCGRRSLCNSVTIADEFETTNNPRWTGSSVFESVRETRSYSKSVDFRSCFAHALRLHLEYRALGIFKHLGDGGRNRCWDTFRSLVHSDVVNSGLSQLTAMQKRHAPKKICIACTRVRRGPTNFTSRDPAQGKTTGPAVLF